MADLDLDAIAFAKTAADPVGHYARPDVLRLMFNDHANPCVVPLEADFAVPGAGDQE